MMTRIPPSLWLAALAALLLTGYLACGAEPEETLPWDTRDTLGLSPTWVAQLPQAQQDEFAQRLRQQATEQAQAQESVHSARPEHLQGPLAPRVALSHLDEARRQEELPPLLFQWTERLDDGPHGQACPLTLEDLDVTAERDLEDAPTWEIDEDFDRPLRDDEPWGEHERQRLDSMKPWLQHILARCAQGAQQPLPRRLELRRAPSAPVALSWWPQAHRLYLNPALLALWSQHSAPLRVSRRALALSGEVSQCIDELRLWCADCTSDSPHEACGDLLDQRADRGCEMLADYGGSRGYALFCINEVADQDRLSACVRRETRYQCDLKLPIDRIEDLHLRHGALYEDPVCWDALLGCQSPAPDPTPDPTPTYDDPQWSDPGDDDGCGLDSECLGACLEIGLECGAQAICDGLSDSDGCDGGSEAGSACDGCEGDVY